jgi:flavodoxin
MNRIGGTIMAPSSLLVVYSYHHHNTDKIAHAFATVLDAKIKRPQQLNAEDMHQYDLVGFGSGIYSGKHHESLLTLADSLPEVIGKKAFIFSTCGVPFAALKGAELRKRFDDYALDNHSALRRILCSKGYIIVDEFSCAGHNTNSFLKLFGGLNKGRPNAEDLELAVEYATALKHFESNKVNGHDGMVNR